MPGILHLHAKMHTGTAMEYLASSHRRLKIKAPMNSSPCAHWFPERMALYWGLVWIMLLFLWPIWGRGNWQSFRKCQHWCFLEGDWFWNYSALGSLKAGLEMQAIGNCSNEISVPTVPVREARLWEWHGKLRKWPNKLPPHHPPPILQWPTPSQPPKKRVLVKKKLPLFRPVPQFLCCGYWLF